MTYVVKAFILFNIYTMCDNKCHYYLGLRLIWSLSLLNYFTKKTFNNYITFIAQFGPWSFGPQHGFARMIRWNLEKPPERLPSGDVEAIFSLMDSDFTRSMWNYQ